MKKHAVESILSLLVLGLVFGSCARRIPEQPRSEPVEYYDKERTEQVRPDEVEPLVGSSADPFEGASLQNPGWSWQNEPANWDVGITRKGWLHIAAENDQNLWDVDTVAKLYQEVSTDKFDVETHLVMNYQGTDSALAGLVAKGPKEDNWVTLKLWGTGRYGGDAILEWQHKQQDLWQQGLLSKAPESSQLGRRAEVFIRMAKDGDKYIGYWKANEDDEWLEITPHAKISLTPPLEVGVYAGIESTGGTATMEFEYFSEL